MIAAVHHATPWFEGLHTYYGMAFIIAILTIGQMTGLWKAIAGRWRRWRAWTLVRDGKAAVTANGVPVSPVILSIPVRLKNLDDGQLKILDEIDKYKQEHGAQVAAIASSIDTLVRSNEELSDKVQKTLKNGLTSNDTGDMVYRIGQKMGLVVPENDPRPARREGDAPTS